LELIAVAIDRHRHEAKRGSDPRNVPFRHANGLLAVRSTNVTDLAATPVSTFLGDGHEDRALLRRLVPQ
jgi:hypothetical protein